MEINDPRFEINQNASLADLGTLAGEALTAFHDESDHHRDVLRDLLFEIHGMIYPNASRPATDEELKALQAQEPSPNAHNFKLLRAESLRQVQWLVKDSEEFLSKLYQMHLDAPGGRLEISGPDSFKLYQHASILGLCAERLENEADFLLRL